MQFQSGSLWDWVLQKKCQVYPISNSFTWQVQKVWKRYPSSLKTLKTSRIPREYPNIAIPASDMARLRVRKSWAWSVCNCLVNSKITTPLPSQDSHPEKITRKIITHISQGGLCQKTFRYFLLSFLWSSPSTGDCFYRGFEVKLQRAGKASLSSLPTPHCNAREALWKSCKHTTHTCTSKNTINPKPYSSQTSTWYPFREEETHSHSRQNW